MHLATVIVDGKPEPCVISERGVALVRELGPGFPGETMALLEAEAWSRVVVAAEEAGGDAFLPREAVQFTAPYRRPRKIWGIGLNYQDHAADLSETAPDQPASFIKGDHTISGPEDEIMIPVQSSRTTVEAELGLIIGKECRNVSEAEALDYVWGVTVILDQTAEDILRLNPRFLTRAKNFPTFFVFGPELVPMTEVFQHVSSLAEIEVSTIVNGAEKRTNTVANMTHGPEALVSFHSQMMPLYPGDIISTGTPGAIVVQDGDLAEAVIPGIGRLACRVVAERR